jgi:predicted kinase
MKAIITIGVSASGKSTWADEYQNKNRLTVRCERDKIRATILNEKTSGETRGRLIWSKWKWKWEDEVTNRFWQYMEEVAQRGLDIIISDTNLNRSRLDQMKQRLTSLGYDEIVEQEFHITFAEACARDTARANGVGHSVIARQFEQYHQMYTEQYHPDKTKPLAAIFDIDGTLAIKGDRSPFEWNKVGLDKPMKHVVNILKSLYDSEYEIIITSGRDSICRGLTEDWLEGCFIPYNKLFMREENDMRKDDVVKAEIFWQHIAPKYNVEMVFDDRPQVTRMWRSIGLNVLQIGNPYIEF